MKPLSGSKFLLAFLFTALLVSVHAEVVYSQLINTAFTTGINQLVNIEQIPILRQDIQVHYEGSIDKKGGNADWGWWLWQDQQTKEWVLLDVDGSGCLWNFVVHHGLGHSDPIYRFYFDGSKTPAFEIRHSEFGLKHPFIRPLADSFIPDAGKDARLQKFNFRIVRSFCPMPFRKGIRITSSVQLTGNNLVDGGGWGHAIYHTYPTSDGINTFTGKEDYSKLLEMWNNVGKDPKSAKKNINKTFALTLQAGQKQTVFEIKSQAVIGSIRLKLDEFNPSQLLDLWLSIKWDGQEKPAADCPVGAFFGNELGYHPISTLMQGTDSSNWMYCYWPMPFWKSAVIELHNRGQSSAEIKVSGEIQYKPASILNYSRKDTGYFYTSDYQPMVSKQEDMDSPVAAIVGHGRMVAGLVTGKKTSCEGDVRVYIDSSGTPNIESDGSESWACYGWGFAFPPQSNPISSYDGRGDSIWSMLRTLPGDFYPFNESLKMTVEGGNGIRGGKDSRSGIVFYYGQPQPGMLLTDEIDIGDELSEKSHKYTAQNSEVVKLTSSYEGLFDRDQITDTGRVNKGVSEFVVKIRPGKNGFLLRRRSDQQIALQRAKVFVDDKEIKERSWYYPDSNPNFRWLDDTFQVPAAYAIGKNHVRIRIEPLNVEGSANWTEYRYWVYSYVFDN